MEGCPVAAEHRRISGVASPGTILKNSVLTRNSLGVSLRLFCLLDFVSTYSMMWQ